MEKYVHFEDGAITEILEKEEKDLIKVVDIELTGHPRIGDKENFYNKNEDGSLTRKSYETIWNLSESTIPSFVKKTENGFIWLTKQEQYSKLSDNQFLFEGAVSEIRNRLSDIDKKSIRPLRAILSGKETNGDRKILEEIEIEAQQLREELQAITANVTDS